MSGLGRCLEEHFVFTWVLEFGVENARDKVQLFYRSLQYDPDAEVSKPLAN